MHKKNAVGHDADPGIDVVTCYGEKLLSDKF